jgi:hypothetical protein
MLLRRYVAQFPREAVFLECFTLQLPREDVGACYSGGVLHRLDHRAWVMAVQYLWCAKAMPGGYCVDVIEGIGQTIPVGPHSCRLIKRGNFTKQFSQLKRSNSNRLGSFQAGYSNKKPASFPAGESSTPGGSMWMG